MSSINCAGKLLRLDHPIIMGIVNITEDSFYDGGKYNNKAKIVARVGQMIEEGADIIDIGVMSSRPGAQEFSVAEEVSRLVTAIDWIKTSYPDALLSVDTYRYDVMSAIVDHGIHMINDISGGKSDERIYKFCADNKLAYIMMHMQGMPHNMQDHPHYNDVVMEVLVFFKNKIRKARQLGLYDIVVDPGFGFGKTLDHNYELLQRLEIFKTLEVPILAGISRKSMIYKVLGTNPENALNGTTACNMIALMKGAKILRVHDIKEAKETIDLYSKTFCSPPSQKASS